MKLQRKKIKKKTVANEGVLWALQEKPKGQTDREI